LRPGSAIFELVHGETVDPHLADPAIEQRVSHWARTVHIVRQHINAVGDVVLTHNGNDPQRSNNNVW
jgi:hypothetical protein